MRSILSIWAVATIMTGLAGGCANYTQPVGPAPAPKTLQQRNLDAIWQASQDVLRKYYFEIDRQDRREMVMTTKPMVGKHWFEFWRHDAATNYDFAESTLQTIYRQATVVIEPKSEGSEMYEASVIIDVSRSDRPTRQVDSVSAAYNMFVLPGTALLDTDLLAEMTTQDQVKKAEAVRGLVQLGQDEKLAARLADQINAAAVQMGK